MEAAEASKKRRDDCSKDVDSDGATVIKLVRQNDRGTAGANGVGCGRGVPCLADNSAAIMGHA